MVLGIYEKNCCQTQCWREQQQMQSDGNSSHGLRPGELKKSIFTFQGNNSNKESSDNFCKPYNEDHLGNWKNLAKSNGFGDMYMRKASDWPLCTIFSNSGQVLQWIKKPHSRSMQNTLRNIHTKYVSNWSRSFKRRRFLKEITLKIGK